ncbi:unnamed protein product [Cochlearia groenlandica]
METPTHSSHSRHEHDGPAAAGTCYFISNGEEQESLDARKNVTLKLELSSCPAKKIRARSAKGSAASVQEKKSKNKPMASCILPTRRSQRRRPLLYTETEDLPVFEEEPGMSEAHTEESDMEEAPSTTFLLRYEENMKLALDRDRRFPEMRRYAGTTFNQRYVSDNAHER